MSFLYEGAQWINGHRVLLGEMRASCNLAGSDPIVFVSHRRRLGHTQISTGLLGLTVTSGRDGTHSTELKQLRSD